MRPSSNSFASTVELNLRPSVRGLRWLFTLHALAMALLLVAQPPAPALLGTAAAMGASWLWLRRHPVLGFGPRALVRLVWHAEGGWTLSRADGALVDGELLGDSVVRGFCLVLRFRCGGHGSPCSSATRLICGDELPAESLRRLRARLSVA